MSPQASPLTRPSSLALLLTSPQAAHSNFEFTCHASAIPSLTSFATLPVSMHEGKAVRMEPATAGAVPSLRRHRMYESRGRFFDHSQFSFSCPQSMFHRGRTRDTLRNVVHSACQAGPLKLHRTRTVHSSTHSFRVARRDALRFLYAIPALPASRRVVLGSVVLRHSTFRRGAVETTKQRGTVQKACGRQLEDPSNPANLLQHLHTLCVSAVALSSRLEARAFVCRAEGEHCGGSPDCCASFYCASRGVVPQDNKCHYDGITGGGGAPCKEGKHCMTGVCENYKCTQQETPDDGDDIDGDVYGATLGKGGVVDPKKLGNEIPVIVSLVPEDLPLPTSL
ncbi:hypothetical protein LshimejAT787_0100370 [Lyophyllum shimeji]|uniref:Uncharacterized protein n=1 Tax=Lyophyllum shimeji TaxID=47721 RepID=A0A9P3PCV3_LYOSH|nr:hypothetical protein LshimejAT787_0100370 [Lyophyllum shimeji]